ncbi:MAG: hypothetical protein V7746_02770 [Halioglobus sp.]
MPGRNKKDPTESHSTLEQMQNGAVTFVDVLGWKGIWLKKQADDVIGKLQQLVDLADKTKKEFRGTDMYVEAEVLSISDTIVILSKGAPEKALQLHAQICAKLIPDSIRKGIPVRGATAYGKFLTGNGTTLVGPAIDEAAAWHEATDWMGVIMTPSAEYQYTPSKPWVKYIETPIKSSGLREFFVVDWSNQIGDKEIRKLFSDAGPLDPAIAPKYKNTLRFLDKMKQDQLKALGGH